MPFYNWAEYIDEELLAEFEAQTGVNVEYTTYESNEEMLTKVESGAAIFDLIVPSDYMVDTMRREGLLLELNYDAIPNSANIGPEWDNPPFDPDHQYHSRLPVGHHRHRHDLRGARPAGRRAHLGGALRS